MNKRPVSAACVVTTVFGGMALAATTIDVSSTVATSQVKRLGVNLGSFNYYDSGQYRKSHTFGNPGFEGELFQSAVRCETGGTTSFVDDDPWSVWPDGFWNGAAFEVIWGAAKGRTGTVSTSTAADGTVGTTFQLTGASPAVAQGDVVVVRKSGSGGATIGWWEDTGGGGTLSTELADLPPGTLGRQALRMTTAAGQSVGVSSFFDSYAGHTFTLMNGSYEVEFKAKAVGAPGSVSVWVQRGSDTPYLDQVVTLSTSWQPYTLPFTAAETATAAGTVGLHFQVSGGDAVLLDEVDLRAVGGNPTPFRDSLVAALDELRPGLLRYWDGQLGDSLDNQLAPPFARQRSGYIAWESEAGSVQTGLHEFLQLCELVGAEPWYVFPITFTPAEMANLVEYLAGPTSSPYGSRRAALGHPTPWTSSFATIHLEFGNEAWNPVFKGGTIEYPDAYGQRGGELFAAAKSSPYYQASAFDLVLGGQAVYIDRNKTIHDGSSSHDSLAVAPYLAFQVDDFATNEELFGPLFAEPEFVNTVDYMRQNYDEMQADPRPVPLSIYEVNLHTTEGQISQSALDAFTPSLGAGIAVANHQLMMMRDLDCRNQMLFALPQYEFVRADGKNVKLWGIVIDMGVTDRRRPQFLAAALANEAIGGDLLATAHSGDDPTWNQPTSNGVTLPNAHFLQSYAFVSGGQHGLIVFNLHRTSPLDVTFSGPNAPSGAVTLKQLTSSSITDGNETAPDVAVTTQSIPSFDPAQPLSLPPHSMTALLWGAGGDDFLLGEGLGPTNGNRVRLFRADASATTVDFQAYGANAWGTNVAAGPLMSTTEPQILTGPGPGAVHGPHVRAFQRDATPVAKVSFFAYGTLRYGANVAAALLDADGYEEILTGAGPGEVFGPHVRGFNVDGGAVSTIARVSFFAYGTLRYGVNVRGGEVDGDGFDEILTGPGPGIIFGPQVRGFDHDGLPVAAIGKINFLAYSTPQYGVNLDGGDADGDGFAEIATVPGPGPGAGFPSRFLGWDYDASGIASMPGFDTTGFTTWYGGRVALGEIDGDGADDLLGGAGRDPAADSAVKAWRYVGSALSALTAPQLPFPGSAYGVNVGAGPFGY